MKVKEENIEDEEMRMIEGRFDPPIYNNSH